jgi:D-alanyl-D-alanine carboxypeptidase
MTDGWLSRRELLSIAGAVALAGPAVALGRDTGNHGFPAAVSAALNQYVPRYLDSMNAPGLTLALVTAAGTTYLNSYGFADVSARARILPAHLFEIGSISKSFAALVLLQMQDEGKLSIHDSVLSHLPWLPIEEPFGPITLHHLLTHTSGFAEDQPVFSVDGRRWRPGFAPGTRFHYSNWAFEVLGLLVESLDGCPYTQSVERRILRPLDMRDSAAAITNDTQSRLVTSYVPRDDDRPYPRHGALTAAGPLTVTNAAGCVAATSRDMTKYMQMLLKGGLSPRGPLISAAAFESLATPHIRAPDFGPTASYGYGIAVDTLNGDKILRHTGGMVSFMSSIHVNLDAGHGAFASINAQQGYRPNRVVRYALQLMRAEQLRRTAPPAAPFNEEMPLEHAADYAGFYESSAGKRLEFRAKDARLSLAAAAHDIPLQMLENDCFLADVADLRVFPLVFEREPGSPDIPGAVRPRVIGVGHGQDWFARDGKASAAAGSDALRSYEGVYYSEDPWSGTVRVVSRRGRLWLRGMTPLEPAGDHLFRFADEPSSPEMCEFSMLVLGKAQLLSINGNFLRRIA